jgi:hypothetical protein
MIKNDQRFAGAGLAENAGGLNDIPLLFQNPFDDDAIVQGVLNEPNQGVNEQELGEMVNEVQDDQNLISKLCMSLVKL